MLRLCEGNLKKGQKHPLISSLGVNQDINTVNTKHSPLYFHSRHGFFNKFGFITELFVNVRNPSQAWLRRVNVNKPVS